jgi:hypothetical protein
VGSVTQLTGSAEFSAGLTAGVVAALAVAGWRLGAPERWRHFPVAGLAHVAGALIALEAAGTATNTVRPDSWGLVAVGFAFAGGLSVQRRPQLFIVALMLVPAGVTALYDLRHAQPHWIAHAVAAAIVVGGALAADLDLAQVQRSLGPCLLVGTAVGIYVTVPDTEAARALVGVAVPLAIVALALPAVALGTGGAAASVTLWMLIVARDGAARPGAVIGGIGSLGLFVCEPVARRIAGLVHARAMQVLDRVGALGVALVLDAAVVWWASRVAGLRRDVVPATVLLIPAVVVGVLGATLLAPPRSPRATTPGSRPPAPPHGRSRR